MYSNFNKIIWYLFFIIEEDNEKPVDAFSANNDIEDLGNDLNDMNPKTYDYIEKIIQSDI